MGPGKLGPFSPMEARAIRLSDHFRYQVFDVSLGNVSGRVWVLPHLAVDAISQMVDELTVFAKVN
jgi:hypothetical protein